MEWGDADYVVYGETRLIGWAIPSLAPGDLTGDGTERPVGFHR